MQGKCTPLSYTSQHPLRISLLFQVILLSQLSFIARLHTPQDITFDLHPNFFPPIIFFSFVNSNLPNVFISRSFFVDTPCCRNNLFNHVHLSAYSYQSQIWCVYRNPKYSELALLHDQSGYNLIWRFQFSYKELQLVCADFLYRWIRFPSAFMKS